MRRVVLSMVLVGTLFCVANAAAMQKPIESSKNNTVNINFKNLKIVDFIKMVAHITGKNILIGQNVQGTVDFVSVKPVRKDEIYDLLINVLDTKGYTIRDTKNGFLKVIRSADAPKSAPPIYGDSDIDEVQTVVIPVENLNVRTILRQVNFLLSKYGKITLSYESNSVVVTDFPSNINTIKNLIRKLDRGTAKPMVQFITLENADAKAVLPKAQKLVSSMFDNKIQTQKVNVFADDATNSIVVVGAKENIRKLVPKIRKLDKGNETIDKRMQIIYVRNANAVDIVKTLEKLLSDKSFAKTHKETQQSKTFSQTVTTPKQPTQAGKNKLVAPQQVKTETTIPVISGKDKPTITVDEELNAVVVYATEREIKEIRNVIEQLDVERQQVYVQAKIVEISKNKAEELGAKYGILGGVANSSGLYGFSGVIGSLDGSDAIGKVVGLLGNSFQIPNVTKALALGTTISLFNKNGVANILSEPSVLCINNKESSLYVGRTESVLTQSTTGNDATSLTRQNYSREDIGLTLKVKPRISEDEKVVLDVKTILEDVIGGQIGLPTTTKREVSTTSVVKNGETVIIGGLVKDKTNKTVNKIPLLGDIPILGIPFRHTSETTDKISLVIMITPYIVKRSEDLGKLREALGRLDLIEKNLAYELEENLKSGKPIEVKEELLAPELVGEAKMEQEPQVRYIRRLYEDELPQHEQEVVQQPDNTTPTNTVESQIPQSIIIIDENGNAFRETRDAQGNLLSKEPVDANDLY